MLNKFGKIRKKIGKQPSLKLKSDASVFQSSRKLTEPWHSSLSARRQLLDMMTSFAFVVFFGNGFDNLQTNNVKKNGLGFKSHIALQIMDPR